MIGLRTVTLAVRSLTADGSKAAGVRIVPVETGEGVK